MGNNYLPRRCMHCITITRRVGGGDDGDRDGVCGVWAYTSEAKTEIMRLPTKDEGKVPFNVTATGQVYKQADEPVYLGGEISADRDLSVKGTRRIQRT